MRNLVFTAAPWVFSNRRYTLEFFDLVILQYSNFLKLSVIWLADKSKIQVPCNDLEFSLESYSVRFSTVQNGMILLLMRTYSRLFNTFGPEFLEPSC